jgi:hypothetical protein
VTQRARHLLSQYDRNPSLSGDRPAMRGTQGALAGGDVRTTGAPAGRSGDGPRDRKRVKAGTPHPRLLQASGSSNDGPASVAAFDRPRSSWWSIASTALTLSRRLAFRRRRHRPVESVVALAGDSDFAQDSNRDGRDAARCELWVVRGKSKTHLAARPSRPEPRGGGTWCAVREPAGGASLARRPGVRPSPRPASHRARPR